MLEEPLFEAFPTVLLGTRMRTPCELHGATAAARRHRASTTAGSPTASGGKPVRGIGRNIMMPSYQVIH